MALPTLFPLHVNGRPLISLCGWCEGYREEHARREAEGYEVTTGICPACREKEFRKAGVEGVEVGEGGDRDTEERR